MIIDCNGYKSEIRSMFLSFLAMADKREQPQDEQKNVFQARGVPDVIPTSHFAATALKALEKDIMHELSSREIRACTNDILNREMLLLADEMTKFRNVIGSRMTNDESHFRWTQELRLQNSMRQSLLQSQRILSQRARITATQL